MVSIAFTVFVFALLAVIFVQRFSDNNITLGGYSVFTVLTGSMEPLYNVNDMLIAKELDSTEIEVGDNIAYLSQQGQMKDNVVTHQVIKKETRNGKTYFVTKGLANEIEDDEITEDQVYGKIIYKFVILSAIGKIVNNNYGFFFLIFIPFVILVFFEFMGIRKDLKENGE